MTSIHRHESNTARCSGVQRFRAFPDPKHLPTEFMSVRLAACSIFALGCLIDSTSVAAQTSSGTRIVWPDEGPRTWTPRPTTTEITANDLRTRIYGLADDSMRGRRIGEPGNFKGTEYIAREFRRLGLKPGGDSGTYFQTLPYGASGFDANAVRMTVAGAPVRLRNDWIPTIPAPANGFGANANWSELPTVFAGRLLDTTTLDPALFRGKIAVFVAPPSAAQSAGGRGPTSFVSCSDVPNKFGADAAIAVESRPAPPRTGAGRGNTAIPPRDQRALQAGAAGVLVVGLDGMPPSAVNNAFAQRMGMRPTAAPSSGPAGATISRAVAQQLFGTSLDQLAVGTAGKTVSANFD